MAQGPNSLEFILLGLLTLRPSTGYDLKKTMDLSVRYISPVALSQIYPTLTRMAQDAMVQYQLVERSGKTNLKIYSITEAGQNLFRKWLAEPLKPDPYRFDTFALRFYFSSMLEKTTLLDHIHTELDFRKTQLKATRNFNETALGNLTPIKAIDLNKTVKIWQMYHQYGLQFLETYTNWLKSILKTVEEEL
jgi:DNA-binding PadR family transcriptional regulator